VTHIPADLMSNATQAAMDASPVQHVPVVAGIYALDGLVRRASSLQMTADARGQGAAQEVAA
jgi:NADH-quinone oxidoreductase subunit G